METLNLPAKRRKKSVGALIGAPKLAFDKIYATHFRNIPEPEPLVDFVRDMQRWARWLVEQRGAEEHAQAEHSNLIDLAQLASAAHAALERLMQHPAFNAHNRFHELWGLYPELEKRTRWLVPENAIPLLSELQDAAQNLGASREVQKPHRGRPHDTAKYDALFDLISIFEWYSKKTATRINDQEGAYGAFRDFAIAAFGAVGITDGATGRLQVALRDHPHDHAKPFSRPKN